MTARSHGATPRPTGRARGVPTPRFADAHRVALGIPLALALGAGCSFPTVSDAYRCETTADCEAGRTCVEGFCVAPDEVDAGSGSGADGPVGNPFDCKTWPAPRHFAPCDLPAPSAPLVLDSGLFTLDTTAGTLTGASAVAVASKLLPAGRVISIERFALNAGTTLRVIGAYPLIIASWGTLEVSGEIDASSAFSPGAGANPSDCATRAAVVGGGSTGGASGGGGGGFQGAGGRGGNGGGGNTPGDGGGSVAAAPLLLGGCPGARGGNGDAQNAGPGGAGGGAVQLTAKQSITISGRVHAGGAGGGGATGSDGAGGGGGSGGMIGLEAPAVTVTASGILAANGGGGGQGVNTVMGGDGQPGAASITAAAGGTGGDGGPGGPGSASTILGGAQGQGSADGAGGGGGGAGYVTIKSGSRQVDASAKISPAATIVP